MNLSISKMSMPKRVTIEEAELPFLQWLQHLQEELMDAAVYVEKLKEEYAEKGPTKG